MCSAVVTGLSTSFSDLFYLLWGILATEIYQRMRLGSKGFVVKICFIEQCFIYNAFGICKICKYFHSCMRR